MKKNFFLVCLIFSTLFFVGWRLPWKKLSPKEAEDKAYEIIRERSPKGLRYYYIDYDDDFEPGGVPQYVTFKKRYKDGDILLSICFDAKERKTGKWCRVTRGAILGKDKDGYYLEIGSGHKKKIFRDKK